MTASPSAQEDVRALHKIDERFVFAVDKERRKVVDKGFVVFESLTVSHAGRFVPFLAQRSAETLFIKTTELTNSIIAKVEK